MIYIKTWLSMRYTICLRLQYFVYKSCAALTARRTDERSEETIQPFIDRTKLKKITKPPTHASTHSFTNYQAFIWE